MNELWQESSLMLKWKKPSPSTANEGVGLWGWASWFLLLEAEGLLKPSVPDSFPTGKEEALEMLCLVCEPEQP